MPCAGELYGEALLAHCLRQLEHAERREVFISSNSVHTPGLSFHQSGHILLHQHRFYLQDQFRGLQALELPVARAAESQQMAKL